MTWPVNHWLSSAAERLFSFLMALVWIRLPWVKICHLEFLDGLVTNNWLVVSKICFIFIPKLRECDPVWPGISFFRWVGKNHQTLQEIWSPIGTESWNIWGSGEMGTLGGWGWVLEFRRETLERRWLRKEVLPWIAKDGETISRNLMVGWQECILSYTVE